MSASFLEPTSNEDGLLNELFSEDQRLRKKAWDYLYRSYYPMICEFILNSKGTEDDATDLFQDSLITVYLNLQNGSFREASSLRTYLFSICRNLWFKELDNRKKRITVPLDGEHGFVSESDIDNLMTVETVSLLMMQLSEDCRSILIEYFFQERTMEELKEIFKFSSTQVAKNRKWRCHGYLLKLFREQTPLN